MLTLYDPFREALRLSDVMQQLLTQSFVQFDTPGHTNKTLTWGVPVNVFQTEQGYQITALLPGIQPEQIELSVQQNMLTLKGQFQPAGSTEKNGYWLVREFGAGTFERSITFSQPIDADRIETSYEHGVLYIWAPVAEAYRPRKISISGTQHKQITVDSAKQPEVVGANGH